MHRARPTSLRGDGPDPAATPRRASRVHARAKARDPLSCNYRAIHALDQAFELDTSTHLRARSSPFRFDPAPPESSAGDPEGKGSERKDPGLVFPRFHSDARRVVGARRGGAEGDERGYLRTAPLSP